MEAVYHNYVILQDVTPLNLLSDREARMWISIS